MAKVFLVSSGLGHVNRGFESNIQKLFDHLKPLLNAELFLLKGGGKGSVPNFRHHSYMANFIGKLVKKHPYEVQNYSFFLGSLYWIIRYSPKVIYLGEPILYRLYSKLRNALGLHFRLVFFSGGGVVPKVTYSQDTIQFVVPPKLIGINPAKLKANYLELPHYTDFKGQVLLNEIQELRDMLKIPIASKVILSVGALNFQKQMDYLIQEFTHLQTPCFLILLGQEEEETPQIRELAAKLLPNQHFIGTVDHAKLPTYYALADAFVLASLKEGFGLVYLEALSFGLPVLAHDFPISRHVLKKWGYFGDFTKKGVLHKLLDQVLTSTKDQSIIRNRKQFVNKHYRWDSVRAEMLRVLTIE